MDDSLQPTIDMLLNVSIFIWFGAVCPWPDFNTNNVIPIYRLIFLGVLVLLLRRLPVVVAMHKHIHQIEQLRQALFVGFFGPIGVSAIFYLYISIDFLKKITVEDGTQRADAAHLQEVMYVVIWFLVICSIVVHGLSIPMGKLGILIPRTLSNAVSSDRDPDEPVPFHIRSFTEQSLAGVLRNRHSASASGTATPRSAATGSTAANLLPRPLYRIGGSVIRSKSGCQQPPPPSNNNNNNNKGTDSPADADGVEQQPPSAANSNSNVQGAGSSTPIDAPVAPASNKPRGSPADELAQEDSSFSSSSPAAVLSPRHTEGQELVLGPQTIRFADGTARNYGTANAERDR